MFTDGLEHVVVPLLSINIVSSDTTVAYFGNDLHNFSIKKEICTCGKKCH
jgi:hypothetical protein